MEKTGKRNGHLRIRFERSAFQMELSFKFVSSINLFLPFLHAVIIFRATVESSKQRLKRCTDLDNVGFGSTMPGAFQLATGGGDDWHGPRGKPWGGCEAVECSVGRSSKLPCGCCVYIPRSGVRKNMTEKQPIKRWVTMIKITNNAARLNFSTRGVSERRGVPGQAGNTPWGGGVGVCQVVGPQPKNPPGLTTVVLQPCGFSPTADADVLQGVHQSGEGLWSADNGGGR